MLTPIELDVLRDKLIDTNRTVGSVLEGDMNISHYDLDDVYEQLREEAGLIRCDVCDEWSELHHLPLDKREGCTTCINCF